LFAIIDIPAFDRFQKVKCFVTIDIPASFGTLHFSPLAVSLSAGLPPLTTSRERACHNIALTIAQHLV